MVALKVCNSNDLQEGSKACRFKVLYNGEQATAFAVRVDNQVRCFLNRCSHLPVEMDWNQGEFLDESGQILVCATHGASYDATSGNCLGGPCNGKPLVPLQIEEKNGGVFWTPCNQITVPPDGVEE